MRQQTRFIDHCPSGSLEILERARRAKPGKRAAGGCVAELGLITEGEESFLATRRCAGARDGDHLVDIEIGFGLPSRHFGKGAIAADVTAETRQRDEHLA